MDRIMLATLIVVTSAGCTQVPQVSALPPLRPAAQAATRPAPTVRAATANGRAGWGINDGIILNDMEQRVFDALPKALKPTPGGTPAYGNWVSNFSIRSGTGNKAFISFSGVRLITTSQFVHTRPDIETFFAGVFEVQSGKVTVYRETLLNDH